MQLATGFNRCSKAVGQYNFVIPQAGLFFMDIIVDSCTCRLLQKIIILLWSLDEETKILKLVKSAHGNDFYRLSFSFFSEATGWIVHVKLSFNNFQLIVQNCLEVRLAMIFLDFKVIYLQYCLLNFFQGVILHFFLKNLQCFCLSILFLIRDVGNFKKCN